MLTSKECSTTTRSSTCKFHSCKILPTEMLVILIGTMGSVFEMLLPYLLMNNFVLVLVLVNCNISPFLTAALTTGSSHRS